MLVPVLGFVAVDVVPESPVPTTTPVVSVIGGIVSLGSVEKLMPLVSELLLIMPWVIIVVHETIVVGGGGGDRGRGDVRLVELVSMLELKVGGVKGVDGGGYPIS